MKKLIFKIKTRNFFFFCLFIFSNTNIFGQIFSQNFNSSATLTDYFDSSPSTNQFRNIATTNSNSTVSVSTNTLVLSKNADVTTNAYAERNVDFGTIPTGLIFQCSFSVSGSYTSSATSAFIFYVGGDVSNSGTVPSNANLYARFSINLNTTAGQFQIRDITNSSNGANWFSGTQTLTWALNNTGSSQTYTAPDNSSETIGNDKADIWVGTTKEFDDITIQTADQSISRFKFLTNGWPNGTVFSIDDIVISNESALPVELTSFTALVNKSSVTLNWQTATEKDNYGFEIQRAAYSGQRSANAGADNWTLNADNWTLNADSWTLNADNWALNADSWTKIGFVQGHGNSNSPKEYSFVDNKVSASGKYLYRLKQIDTDGSFEYSEVVEVDFGYPNNFELMQNYPNPFNPITKIKFTIPTSPLTPLLKERGRGEVVTLKIFDILGNEVATLVNEEKDPGIYEVEYNPIDVPAGIYFYELRSGDFKATKKLILLK